MLFAPQKKFFSTPSGIRTHTFPHSALKARALPRRLPARARRRRRPRSPPLPPPPPVPCDHVTLVSDGLVSKLEEMGLFSLPNP